MFARDLKERGLPVTLSRTLGAVEGLKLIRLEEKEEVYPLFYSHFVSRPEEIPIFDRAFEAFWGSIGSRETPRPLGKTTPFGAFPVELVGEAEGPAGQPKRDRRLPAYSPGEDLSKKDFGELTGKESEEAARVIAALAQTLGQRLGRRFRPAPRGRRVDLSRTLRRSLRHGGDPMVLEQKQPRPRKTRFVVLCDVSGSMDGYSRFLLEFMYGFQKNVPRVETFVFSTRLSYITRDLRLRRMGAAYERVSEKVKDWSGGTRIGGALKEYNRRYGGKFSGTQTVFVLLSDGWDQGEIPLLDRELVALKKRVRRLMWLNPLLGMPDYRPIDRGMKAALPHTDDFLDCHDLEKLEEFGHSLAKVAQN
ncbi:MAG TPA: VWA domain-containing protein [Desulfobaccales bacterium]|nr:VWA domain-containing protein [Desulfobaccales bacterium]